MTISGAQLRALSSADAGLDVAKCYARFGRTVLRRDCALMGDATEAKEVLQDVFLTLHEKPEQLPLSKRPRAVRSGP